MVLLESEPELLDRVGLEIRVADDGGDVVRLNFLGDVLASNRHDPDQGVHIPAGGGGVAKQERVR